MPNANTQIANLNEANLHSILAAIAELRERVADDQRAWDRLKQQRDAASTQEVAGSSPASSITKGPAKPHSDSFFVHACEPTLAFLAETLAWFDAVFGPSPPSTA
jgi:hypothetical protein